MSVPAYRYLRGYSLDPGFSTRLDTARINEVVYRIPFEPVEPGPRGEYVEVMDFDPASNCWYEPVDLASEEIASQQGLAPSEGNPQFHQQFVYAVVMKTIRHFEVALGRKVLWSSFRIDFEAPPSEKFVDEYIQRLRIHPHALRDANAYYDPDKRALLFGYFSAAEQSQGANYPGGLVFTCLSPDIVAHECTHALLDSIHPRYIEDTNPDVAAFHEGFADIVALLQRFTFAELVEHQLFASGGRLDRYTVLGELATQFGEALEDNRGALRSMIGRWNKKGKWVPLKPNPRDYVDNIEEHDRGAVLVAAIFDAFQRTYTFRTRDLLRIATSGTGVLPEGSISRDLVHRLAGEASEIARHLLHICIRALDYCPPHDISFGDYLRALITADLDIAPEDETGYRLALIEAFRARGIFPDRVNTLSVESLRWDNAEFTPKQNEIFEWLAGTLQNDVRSLIDAGSRAELFDRSKNARAGLSEQLKTKAAGHSEEEWESFLNVLGLTSQPVSKLFGKEGTGLKFENRDGNIDPDYIPPIQVLSLRPAFRAGREGRQIEQVLVTLTQSVSVRLNVDGQTRTLRFRGGCSLVLDLGNLKSAKFVVVKNIKSWRRFSRQKDYMLGDSPGSSMSMSLYADDNVRARELNFALLHSR